jgi:uncharacterized protein (TIGR02217 family)
MAPPVFPLVPGTSGLTYPAKRSIEWSGNRFKSLGGKRTAQSYYSYPIYHYEVPISVLRSDAVNLELQTLMGFVNSLLGGTGLFLYPDPTDFLAPPAGSSTQGFGVGDGVSPTFQLVRSWGGFTEPVFFPNVITQIAVGGVPTAAYTLGNYGQVTFTTAPALGAALTWSGTFYWGCRFDEDLTELSQFMQTLWDCKALKFSTEKLP